jgi:hypothetical protein
MKKIFIAVVAVIAMVSCKKENVTTTVTPATTKDVVKLTNVWENDPPETNEFTYDAQRRIAIQKNETDIHTFNYVSPTSLIVTERKASDNSLIQTKECTLNDKGYITSLVNKNSAGTITYTYNYTYNVDGYVIRVVLASAVSSRFEIDYTIANGNVISSKHHNNGILSFNGEYTYDNSKLNKTPIGHFGNWPSYTLFGKRSKNLLGEYKAINPAGAITWHHQYVYEMDADGYPAKVTKTDVLHNEQGVENYTYH